MMNLRKKKPEEKLVCIFSRQNYNLGGWICPTKHLEHSSMPSEGAQFPKCIKTSWKKLLFWFWISVNRTFCRIFQCLCGNVSNRRGKSFLWRFEVRAARKLCLGCKADFSLERHWGTLADNDQLQLTAQSYKVAWPDEGGFWTVGPKTNEDLNSFSEGKNRSYRTRNAFWISRFEWTRTVQVK